MLHYQPRPNNILEKRRLGKIPFGLFCYSRSSEVIEVAALAGFDFVLIDTEHVRMNPETLQDLIRTCDASNITPIVRVEELNRSKIRAAVECGARGVMVPHIMSAEDARIAVSACHYAPIGDCSVCGAVRAAHYEQETWDEYTEWANKNISFHALLEDPCAIENAEAILNELTPGRDFVHIGGGDIAGALAKPGEKVNWSHPDVAAANEKVIRLAKERGIDVGGMTWPINAPNLEAARNSIKMGKTSITCFPDVAMFLELFKGFINDMAEFK